MYTHRRRERRPQDLPACLLACLRGTSVPHPCRVSFGAYYSSGAKDRGKEWTESRCIHPGIPPCAPATRGGLTRSRGNAARIYLSRRQDAFQVYRQPPPRPARYLRMRFSPPVIPCRRDPVLYFPPPSGECQVSIPYPSTTPPFFLPERYKQRLWTPLKTIPSVHTFL